MASRGLGCRLAVSLALIGLVAGCRQEMADQPRYEPLEPSRLFVDGISERRPVPGTVARGRVHDDPHLLGGFKADAKLDAIDDEKAGKKLEPSLERAADYADTFPLPIDADFMARGRERFRIYCAPCHGSTGFGSGTIVRAGYPKAESFHTERLRQAPVGYLFDVVTHGYKAMPSFRPQLPVEDRWAIIAYLRALQLSRHAELKDLPEPIRRRFADIERQ
jgi:mono/diheme cytochrome c family protein